MFTFEFEVILELTLPAQDDARVANVVAAEAAQAAKPVCAALEEFEAAKPTYIERPHHDH